MCNYLSDIHLRKKMYLYCCIVIICLTFQVPHCFKFFLYRWNYISLPIYRHLNLNLKDSMLYSPQPSVRPHLQRWTQVCPAGWTAAFDRVLQALLEFCKPEKPESVCSDSSPDLSAGVQCRVSVSLGPVLRRAQPDQAVQSGAGQHWSGSAD